jgi:hypothetical protein
MRASGTPSLRQIIISILVEALGGDTRSALAGSGQAAL